jgi:hypothetical protein
MTTEHEIKVATNVSDGTPLSTGGRPPQPTDSFGDSETPPMVALPVEGRPGFYVIDGLMVGPDTVFSYAKTRLKGRPYMRAKAYVVAECQRKRGALVCELGSHYLTEITAEVHHWKRKSLHVARWLGVACHSHNSKAGEPGSAYPSETGERAPAMPIDIERASAEVRINVDNFPLYEKLLTDELNEKHSVSVHDAIFRFARKLREKTGHGSPQATRNYLNTLTAGEDALFETAENMVRFKEPNKE